MTEADLSKRIVDWLNTLPDCHAEKRWTGGAFSRVGEPDITCCLRGWRLEIETKLPGEEARKIQLARLRAWERAGAIVGVAQSLEDAKRIVERVP